MAMKKNPVRRSVRLKTPDKVRTVLISMALAWTSCVAQEITDPYQPEAGIAQGGPAATNFHLRIRMGADVPQPAVIHLFGRYSRAVNGQYFPPHANITRRGLFRGTNTGISEDGVLGPGQESPWIDLGPILGPKGRTHLSLDAIVGYREYLPSCSFTVDVSRTPGVEGLIASFERTGKGSRVWITIDPEAPTPVLCSEEQAPALAKQAAALPPSGGRRPQKFPIVTGFSINETRDSARVVDANLSVLGALGLNGIGLPGFEADRLKRNGFNFFVAKGYLQSGWCKERCWLEPNLDEFRVQLERFAVIARGLQPALKPIFWMLGDEYGSRRMTRIRDEALYHPHFRSFLRDLGLQPQDVGAESWDEVLPATTDDRDTAPARFYYSCLFRNEVLATHLRNGSRIVNELLPGVPTAMNFPEDATYHSNLLRGGGDWFRVMQQGDLGFGWTETWLPYNETTQVTTYHYALMRAACRLRGQPYGFYIIVHGSRPWDNAAKAASAAAHGAQALHFYNYGPRHSGVQDAWSHKTPCYASIRDTTYRIGAVEDRLLNARPVPSQAAIVYSHSSDIRNLHLPNSPYGGERVSLHLLLQHIGIPTEFVTEEDVLEDRIGDYKLLFLVDAHLLPDVPKRLLDWVSAGGVLYCSAGSAMADHLDRPADGLAPVGIQREAFQTMPGCPGRAMLSYHALQSQGTAKLEGGEAFDLSWALQPLKDVGGADIRLTDKNARPLAGVFPHGRGRIIYTGFWPGISYRRAAVVAKRAEDKAAGDVPPPANTTTSYPAAYRRLMTRLLDPLPFQRSVTVDDPYVEARVLKHDKGRLLFLVNWSGESRNVTARIVAPAGSAKPCTVSALPADIAYADGAWAVRLSLGTSAIVEIAEAD